jgi:hypothetical protein
MQEHYTNMILRLGWLILWSIGALLLFLLVARVLPPLGYMQILAALGMIATGIILLLA